ncbi:MAG: hypothetical protein QXS42_07320 [Zestosphaera sp.]
MPALKEWRLYIPRFSVSVNGARLPSPYRDEDEITMAYETLNRLSINDGSSFVFVYDGKKDVDFHVVLDLIGRSDAPIVTFKSFSEGLAYSIRNTPSVLTAVSADPPAGSVTLTLNSKGKTLISRYELKKEFLGFLKTEITDERALSELIVEASTSTTSRILTKLSKSRRVRNGQVRVVSGFVNNPRLLDRVLASLKLKSADSSVAEEIRKSGYKGSLGTALALVKVAERCNDGEKLVFVGGSISEGIIILYMKCSGG